MVGAGLGGLSAAVPPRRARATTCVVSSASAAPGRAGRRVEAGGYRFDTGPTVLTMPDLLADDASPPPAPTWPTSCTLAAGRPDVPRRASPTAASCGCGTAASAMAAEIRDVCGPATPRRSAGSATGSPAVPTLEMPQLHRPQLRPRARPRPSAAAPALRARSASAASAGSARVVRLVLRRRAAAAHLQLPVDVRRPRAVRGPRPLRRHHLHGHGRRACTPRSAACTPCRPALATAAEKAGAELPLRHVGRADPAGATARAGRCAACELDGGERVAADAVVCNADLPVAYRTLSAARPAARRPPRPVFAVVPALW